MSTRQERYRFQNRLARSLEQTEDLTKLYKTALGQIAQHFDADGGAVVLRAPVSGALRALAWGRSGGDWDERQVRAFLDQGRPDLGEKRVMAPIVVGGRAIGVLTLQRLGQPFQPGDGRWLTKLCRKLAHEVSLRDERRINRVVDQIKDKTVRELRPKDLFYQVLHGLRTLTRYDHSSALLIAEEDGARLVLHAEQIAWAKAKSGRIGRRIRVPERLRPALRRAAGVRVVSFATTRKGAKGGPLGVCANGPRGAAALARLLRWGGRRGEPAEGTILLVPLHHERELLGLLKIAARRPGALGDTEAAAVSRVVRHVASMIHNARRALSMEERIIEAEKKHAMADLARAISHDVKNAIGAILPLAQQAREELETGSFDRLVLSQDLSQIEQSARVCQRIFDGMLQLARSGVRPVERASLAAILDGTLSILGARLKRSGVALELKIPDGLPEINASRGGLEQLFLNLLTNALESMPAGGKLKVGARALGSRVEVKVADTGSGIPPEQLKRIHEPFYTTKSEGFGLGLAICRSILWDVGGEMTIDSRPGRGTTVIVLLPSSTGDGKPADAPPLAESPARGASTRAGAPPSGSGS
ncbi:MAG: sensor histidine kinase [Acidobacteriota bacterium]